MSDLKINIYIIGCTTFVVTLWKYCLNKNKNKSLLWVDIAARSYSRKGFQTKQGCNFDKRPSLFYVGCLLKVKYVKELVYKLQVFKCFSLLKFIYADLV